MDFDHVGDSRCHFGDDRTWRLVHRCPALRQEAHRYSGIVGGISISPKGGPSILTIQGTRHPTIWGCPQGEVGFTIAAKNQRPGKQRWKWNCSRYPRADLAKTEHRAQRIVGTTNTAWRNAVLSEDQNDV